MDLFELLADLGAVDRRVEPASGTFEPIGVVIHHTACGSLGGGPIPSLTTVQFGDSTLPGPRCNVLIGRDASVNVITDGKANDTGTGDPHVFDAFNERRPLPQPDDEPKPKKNPNGHFMSGNKFFFDIEVENTGTGNEPYPPEQVEMTGRVAAAICKANGFAADRVLCHKEWTRRKIDWSHMSGDDTRALVARFMGEGEEDEIKATYVQHDGHSEVWLAGLGLQPRHVVLFDDADFVAELTGVQIVQLEPTPPKILSIEDGAGKRRVVQIVDDKGAALYGLPTAP
jgi:N-acetylmuramoyl-L-alanine amidase